MMAATPPSTEEVPSVEEKMNDDSSFKVEANEPPQPKSVTTTADDAKEAIEPSEAAAMVSPDSALPEDDTVDPEQPGHDDDDKITFEDFQAAVDEMDENLDEAFGHAADSFWNFATSVRGKVSSVVNDQSGLETLRKNVTSHLPPLNDISRDIQSQIGTIAPDEKSIASIAGSVKSVAESVQRSAVAMEEAILAKANDVGDSTDAGATAMSGTEELTMGDPSVGVIPDMRGSKGLDEIARVGESVSNALGQTVGGLWSGLWGADVDETELHQKKSKVPKTRFGKRIFELQANPDTYCEPAEDLDAFEEWGKDFNLDNCEEECIELLYAHDPIAELYERVVPRVVEENTFWMRYFFAKHNLEMEEERRQKLLERAESAVKGADDEEDGWGDDDWDDETADGGDAGIHVRDGPGEGSSQAADRVEECTAPIPETPAPQADKDRMEKPSTASSDGPEQVAIKTDDTQIDKKKEDMSHVKRPAAQVTVQKADDDWGDDDWE